MNSAIGQRLKSFLEVQKMTQEEFAEHLQVVPQNVSSWMKGKTAITTKYFPVILNLFPDLDARWLLTGEYTATGENPLIIEDPHHPYAKECTNPACKKELLDLIEKHQIEKDRLWSHIDDLTRKVGPPSENTSSGGVEEHRKTG